MDEKRFQELDEKYRDLWDGEVPPEREEYEEECMRRALEEWRRRKAQPPTP